MCCRALCTHGRLAHIREAAVHTGGWRTPREAGAHAGGWCTHRRLPYHTGRCRTTRDTVARTGRCRTHGRLPYHTGGWRPPPPLQRAWRRRCNDDDAKAVPTFARHCCPSRSCPASHPALCSLCCCVDPHRLPSRPCLARSPSAPLGPITTPASPPVLGTAVRFGCALLCNALLGCGSAAPHVPRLPRIRVEGNLRSPCSVLTHPHPHPLAVHSQHCQHCTYAGHRLLTPRCTGA